MISPLGQRQIFQTANVEAVRQAHEVSEQIQRENVKKRILDEHLLEDQASVKVVSESGKIQLHEREGNRGESASEEEATNHEPKETQEETHPAESADAHLDFLA